MEHLYASDDNANNFLVMYTALHKNRLFIFTRFYIAYIDALASGHLNENVRVS